MNFIKPIIVVVAMAITGAGLFAIANYSNAAIAVASQGAHATAQTIPTLQTIEVRPTAEQLRALRQS